MNKLKGEKQMKSIKRFLLLIVALSIFAPIYADYANTLPQMGQSLGFFLTQNGMVAKRIDTTTSALVIYFGWANAGAVNADASWAICRLTLASLTYEWASGRTDMSNIWDNRASLTYK